MAETLTAEKWGREESADWWSAGQAARQQIYGAATEMMLDLAGVKAGSRVLDVAAGTGEGEKGISPIIEISEPSGIGLRHASVNQALTVERWRSRPYGAQRRSKNWKTDTADQLALRSTVRARGRPRNAN